MRLSLAQARESIRRQALWVWRQEHWGHAERYGFDADLEETGHQYPGAAGNYFEVPNR